MGAHLLFHHRCQSAKGSSELSGLLGRFSALVKPFCLLHILSPYQAPG